MGLHAGGTSYQSRPVPPCVVPWALPRQNAFLGFSTTQQSFLLATGRQPCADVSSAFPLLIFTARRSYRTGSHLKHAYAHEANSLDSGIGAARLIVHLSC